MSSTYRISHHQTTDDDSDEPVDPIMYDGKLYQPIKIIVQMMRGPSYIFVTETPNDTYGNLKTVLLHHLNFSPKPLRRQLVFMQGVDYKPEDNHPITLSTKNPVIKLLLFIDDIVWSVTQRGTHGELELINRMRNGRDIYWHDIKPVSERGAGFMEAFLWALQDESETTGKIKSLSTRSIDLDFLFDIVRSHPNIEILSYSPPVSESLIRDPRIPSVKKLLVECPPIPVSKANIMNIVRSNPGIETLIIGESLNFTQQEMRQFFEIIKTSGLRRLTIVGGSEENEAKAAVTNARSIGFEIDYFKHINTYQMKDLLYLLNNSGLHHVNFIYSNVVMENGDGEALRESLKNNPFLQTLNLSKQKIISSENNPIDLQEFIHLCQEKIPEFANGEELELNQHGSNVVTITFKNPGNTYE